MAWGGWESAAAPAKGHAARVHSSSDKAQQKLSVALPFSYQPFVRSGEQQHVRVGGTYDNEVDEAEGGGSLEEEEQILRKRGGFLSNPLLQVPSYLETKDAPAHWPHRELSTRECKHTDPTI